MNHLQRLALSGVILSTTVGLMGCPDPAVSNDTGAEIDTGAGIDAGAPGEDAGARADTGASRDVGPVPGDAAVPPDAFAPDAFAPRCGDSAINGTDVCDDGNTTAGDGCSTTCTAEAGFDCNTASPTVCTAVCGDGMRVGAESAANGCDDSNTTAGDGCGATCLVESGFSCTGAPSLCMTGCGDGIVAGTETCDDSNTTDGDGCAMSCASETGFSCTGSPSTCTATCGDGTLAVGRETCDDMNVAAGDGCSATCATEPGFTCTGTTCTTTCGDGITVGGETCDDGNTTTEACAYGLMSCMVCDATCSAVPGMTSFCGNRATDGMETCDDGNAITEACAYGAMSCTVCDAMCLSAPGPTSFCGNGATDASGMEVCDDGNTVTEACAYGAIGCSVCNATCQSALGATSRCGDARIDAANGETCDDGGTTSGNGCSATCTVELGYACRSAPSVCSPVCGDGILAGPETCDDGFTQGGDGCSGACRMEAGFVCAGTPTRCTWSRTTLTVVAIPDDNAAGVRIPVPVTGNCRVLGVSASHTWEPNHTYSSDLVMSIESPDGSSATLSNRAGGSNELDGPYTFASTGAVWPGVPAAPSDVIPSGSYAANMAAIIGGSSFGVWNLFVRDLNSGDNGSISSFSVTITCDPAPLPALLRTCGEIRTATPGATDGLYYVDPDGAGAVAPARVYCDMTSGGWTLVMASNTLGPDTQVAADTVLPNSGRYLRSPFARALATASSQVHIRTAGAIATRSITSVANTLPIENLRAGLILTNNSPFRGSTASIAVAALWTGPFAANAEYLWHSCGPAPFGVSVSYPAIYHACNNGGGMHLLGATAGWTSAGGENMEVYVR